MALACPVSSTVKAASQLAPRVGFGKPFQDSEGGDTFLTSLPRRREASRTGFLGLVGWVPGRICMCGGVWAFGTRGYTPGLEVWAIVHIGGALSPGKA